MCLCPQELPAKLVDLVSRQFADELKVKVIPERRTAERRSLDERRHEDTGPPEGSAERRKIRNPGGRRVGERRAALVPVDPPGPLPRKVRAHADRIVFCERVEPSAEQIEDLDIARLVTRIQAGDKQGFAELYHCFFDRVYGYLRLLLRDTHEAEDLAQQVFLKAFEALADYERRGRPFRAWLFTIARNTAVAQLRKQGRLDVTDPAEIARHEEARNYEPDVRVLEWISDGDLLLFVERLPVAQRQVLTLRFMLDLSTQDIAEILGRSPNDIAVLQYRALGFLRDRLAAIGRGPARRRGRSQMRERMRPARILRRRRFALTP